MTVHQNVSLSCFIKKEKLQVIEYQPYYRLEGCLNSRPLKFPKPKVPMRALGLNLTQAHLSSVTSVESILIDVPSLSKYFFHLQMEKHLKTFITIMITIL